MKVNVKRVLVNGLEYLTRQRQVPPLSLLRAIPPRMHFRCWLCCVEAYQRYCSLYGQVSCSVRHHVSVTFETFSHIHWTCSLTKGGAWNTDVSISVATQTELETFSCPFCQLYIRFLLEEVIELKTTCCHSVSVCSDLYCTPECLRWRLCSFCVNVFLIM